VGGLARYDASSIGRVISDEREHDGNFILPERNTLGVQH